MPLRPIVQIADLGGPLLLTAVQAAINGAAADVLLWRTGTVSQSPMRPLLAVSLLVCLCVGYGAWRLNQVASREESAPHLRVGLSQPNIGETELHQNPQASVETVREQTYQLTRQGAELVIWPEVAFNTRSARLDDPALARVIPPGIPFAIIPQCLPVD